MSVCRITLEPTGVHIQAVPGANLSELLFEQGVEFPCGGNGRCRGCRIRVARGELPISPVQSELLKPDELAQGWRLACQCRVSGDLTIELRQWDSSILVDHSQFVFVPRDGLGVAVDVGTTTLAAQLLDMATGHVLAVKTGLNPQARHGADLMSRVQFAVAEHGRPELERLIRSEILKLIRMLITASGVKGEQIREIVLVGNTVMHHLFCGVDVEPLSRYPFEPVDDGEHRFPAEALGWPLGPETLVRFLPCLGGFVGSDLLAGILATGMAESESLSALIDLGTNGEILIGNRDRILCASTAAGPAFEGARISAGMRAATGAIWKVSAVDGRMVCETLGSGEPRGICGSGLVDAAAVGLDLGRILSSGRIADGRSELKLTDSVSLNQTDIRQLQLAKGAIAAGIRLLLAQSGGSAADVERVFLAGAFGNYVDRAGARRIGLLPFDLERIEPAGNTALLGAKIALFLPESESAQIDRIRARVAHITLNELPEFVDAYVEEMAFPGSPIERLNKRDTAPVPR